MGFCAVARQLGEDLEGSPLYESSKLTHLLKDYLGGNAFSAAVLYLANGDPSGSIKTLSFIKVLSQIPQYPIFNNGESVGLLHHIRMDKAFSVPASESQPISGLESEKMIL